MINSKLEVVTKSTAYLVISVLVQIREWEKGHKAD